MRGSLGVTVICTIYLILAGMFGTAPLDEDEFTFIASRTNCLAVTIPSDI